jgi:hypothetical protein
MVLSPDDVAFRLNTHKFSSNESMNDGYANEEDFLSADMNDKVFIGFYIFLNDVLIM